MAEGFLSLKKDELVHVATEFGVDFDEKWTKQEIEKALNEDGVYWDDYQRFAKANDEATEELVEETLSGQTEEESAPTEKGEKILVRMTRKNPTYDIRGARFTQQKPFAFLAEEDAEWVIENVEGFRMALPKEVREFYGK